MYNNNTNSHYKFSNETKDWESAAAFCSNYYPGVHLVFIESEIEQKFLEEKLKEIKCGEGNFVVYNVVYNYRRQVMPWAT